jgi:hypothetical protein
MSLKTSNKRKESFKFKIYIYCILIRNVCMYIYIYSLHFFCLVGPFSSPNTIYSYPDTDDIHILRSRLNDSTRFVFLRAYHPYIYPYPQACLLALISSLIHIHLPTYTLLSKQKKMR